MVLSALLLPWLVSHSKQHFAISAWAVLFIAKPPNSPQSPLGACSELRHLQPGAQTECKRAASLLCVPQNMPSTAQISPDQHLIKSTRLMRYKCQDRDNSSSIYKCDGPWWRVDLWFCPRQGDKLRKRVWQATCDAEKPMGDESTHPAPPVAEFRWEMPNVGEKLGLWVLESNFPYMVFKNLNFQIVNDDLWREPCKLSFSSWWDGIIYYFNFSD